MITVNTVANFNCSEEKNRSVAVPKLLKSANRIAVKRLSQLMDTMFNNTDDCLFEYADKAANNEQQTVYLHAMREIRLKKDVIKKAFFADLDRQFSQKLSLSEGFSPQYALSQQNDFSSGMGLSLVDEDDLEESLAITNMVRRVYSEYREPLSALIQRINEIHEAKEIDKESNPLSPDIICSAFSSAVGCLSANLEIRLIFYKLFDKFVVRNIGQLYHEINEMFVAAGVLPTIKYKMPVNRSSSNHKRKAADDVDSYLQELMHGQVNAPANSYANVAPVAATQPGHDPAVADPGANVNVGNVFEAMRLALNQYRTDGGGQGPHSRSGATTSASPAGAMAAVYPGAQTAAHPPGGGATPAQSATATGINGASDSVEGSASAAPAGGTIYYVTSDVITGLSRIQNNAGIVNYHKRTQNSGEVIKSQVLQVVQGQNEENEKSLNDTDADVIDIVSMMFDYILNDKSLPDRTKAVIARLQIPLVKVAILDKAFFSKKTHPARALLNELANASNVLDSEYDDGDTLFEEIERIVNRILDEFDSNVELFEELLTEFLEFEAREIQANRLAEQMVLDAKQKVADEIEKRLRHRKVPPLVSQFILGPWKDVLTVVGTRDQCEGIAWNSASTFLDDLIWSVQPKHFNDERHQLTMLIPRMLPALREGMASLKDHNYNLTGFLEELQKIHLQALRVHKPSAAHGGAGSMDDSAFDENAQWEDFDDATSAPGKSASNADDFMDDIILQGDKHDSYQFDIADPQLMQSRFFTTVRTMELGTWVEFKTEDGSKRGKLTWKCDFTGEYTFMNRMYKVVADIGMRELINCMEAGSASIVEDTPMFDRAVNAIMSSVKSMRGTQPVTST